MATETTYGARDHARAQEGIRTEAMPVVPAGDWPDPSAAAGPLVWAETVAGGNYTHRVLARGTELRLTDLHGDACAHLLLYAEGRPWERLNVADTVKVQWNAYLGEGQLLLSDQGRVLASVVADTSGRHDALCGTSTLVRNTARYGDGTSQSPSPAGRELFKLAAAKNGLEPRDLPPSLLLPGRADPRGRRPRLHRFRGPRRRRHPPRRTGRDGPDRERPAPRRPAARLRQHPLEVLAWRAEPTRAGDPLWDATPEGRRAFLNTAEFLASKGHA